MPVGGASNRHLRPGDALPSLGPSQIIYGLWRFYWVDASATVQPGLSESDSGMD